MAKYSILTIGDGLVAQIPALLGAMSGGSDRDPCNRTTRRTRTSAIPFRSSSPAIPRVMLVAGGMCFLLALVPGFPTMIFLLVGFRPTWLCRFSRAGTEIAHRSEPGTRFQRCARHSGRSSQRKPRRGHRSGSPASRALDARTAAVRRAGERYRALRAIDHTMCGYGSTACRCRPCRSPAFTGARTIQGAGCCTPSRCR